MKDDWGFPTIDPHLEDYYSWSPYVYCYNNPMKFVDPTGQYPIWSDWGVTTRSWGFALRHPLVAIASGFPDLQKINISSNVARVARGTGLPDNRTSEGSYVNAFRHVLWQAKLTQDYGKDVASYAGQTHEKYPYAATQKEYNTKFQDMEHADGTVDLLNNYIGRSIGESSSGLSNKEIATKVLSVFKTAGLWVVNNIYDDNGDVVGFRISREVITQKQYDDAINNLKNIDDNGQTEEERKKSSK